MTHTGSTETTLTTSWENLTMDQLHEQEMIERTHQGQDLMDYLLQVAPILSTDDKTLFVKTFHPEWLQVVQTPPKCVKNPDLCSKCGSVCAVCAETNSVTCTQCGLVNCVTFLGNDQDHMSFDQLSRLDRKHPHLYDRLVHFRNYIRRLMAEETVKVPLAHDQTLRAILDGFPCIDPRTVEVAIKQTKLGKLYSPHCVQLARLLGNYKPVQISGIDVYNLLQLFRRVSRHWHYYRKEIAPGRKSFLSYSFVFYQLAFNLGHSEWTHDVKLPRHTRTLWKQVAIWEKICKVLELKTFAPK